MGLFDTIKKSLLKISAPGSSLPPIVKVYDTVNLCYIHELGDSLDKATVGAEVRLEREETNPVDKSAVAVKCAGERIGYLYKGKLKTLVFKKLSSPDVIFTGVITKRNGTEITMDIEHREDITVCVSSRGKSYHKDPWCVKDASDAREIKLSEALKAGYKPCSKCCK